MTQNITDIILAANSTPATTTMANVTDNTNQTLLDGQWVNEMRFAIEGVTQGIVGLAGLIGNVVAIAVLFRRDMDLKPTFMQILITLISFDIFCIVFNLMLFCLPHISHSYFDNIFPYIVPYILPLAQIALTGSIYSTLAVAIERYVSVCHPHYVGFSEAGRLSVAGLILFSVIFNICRFLEFETTYEEWTTERFNSEKNMTESIVVIKASASATELRKNQVYSQVTMVIFLVVSGVIPLVVLIALNTKIYLAIKERTRRLASLTSRQRRDVAVAGVLVGIILVFIICHSFKFFVNIYEAYIMHFGMDMESAWTAWMDAVVSFSHLLSTVNSSLNFLIYCWKDDKFRSSLMTMMKAMCGKGNHGVIVV